MLRVARGACRTTLDSEKVCGPQNFNGNVSIANPPKKASWKRILEILNVNSFLLDWTDFWGRNDPDMLEVKPYTTTSSPLQPSTYTGRPKDNTTSQREGASLDLQPVHFHWRTPDRPTHPHLLRSARLQPLPARRMHLHDLLLLVRNPRRCRQESLRG